MSTPKGAPPAGATSPASAVIDLEQVRPGFCADAIPRSIEARLRLATEGSGVGTWDLDFNTGEGSWSPECAGLLGATRTEFTGDQWLELVHADDRKNVADCWGRAVADATRYEAQFRPSFAPERWLLAKGQIEHQQGKARRAAGVLIDVTERHRAEAALAETEAEARDLLATLDLGVFMARDMDGTIRHWSAGCQALYGWSATEAVGQLAHDLLQTRFSVPLSLIESTLQFDGKWSGELRQRTRDGREITILAHKVLRRAAAGRVSVLEALTDLTQRKAAEERLAESEKHLRLALDAGRMGLWTWDLKSDRVQWDRRQFEIFGLNPDHGQPSGSEAFRLVHRDDLPALHAAIESAIARQNEGAFSAEFRIVLPDRTVRWTSSHGHVVLGADGNPARIVGLNFDVTRSREAAEVLAREAAQLEELAERRAQALARSELRLAEASRMEALGRLAGGIAHDFNNILQAVQVRVQAADHLLHGTTKVKEHLDQAVAAVQRGAAVTSRLLTFARRSQLRAEPIVPASLLDQTVEMLRPTLGAQYPLELEIAPDLPAIMADRSQLEAVLVNLANNARDAMPGGGRVQLRAESRTVPDPAAPVSLAPGCYIRIAVIDQGEGMPSEVLARVTEPFFTTKAMGKGTGLGLAMARGFAEQSGGALEIQSKPQQGTTVGIWLPRSATDAASPAFPIAVAARAARPSGRAWRPSLLLAEDDADIREVLAEMLEQAGFVVAAADHGLAAIALMDGGLRPDVLVTDFAMPGELDGLSLAAEARKRLPRLPTVLVTGHAGAASVERMTAIEQNGPFALMRKPVTAKTLVDRIERVMGLTKEWRTAR